MLPPPSPLPPPDACCGWCSCSRLVTTQSNLLLVVDSGGFRSSSSFTLVCLGDGGGGGGVVMAYPSFNPGGGAFIIFAFAIGGSLHDGTIDVVPAFTGGHTLAASFIRMVSFGPSLCSLVLFD